MKYFPALLRILVIVWLGTFTPLVTAQPNESKKVLPSSPKTANPVNKIAPTPTIIVRTPIRITPTATPTLTPIVITAAGAAPFTFDDVIRKAQVLAKGPFDDNAQNANPSLDSIGYDDYRKIRFNKEVNLLPPDFNFRIETQATGFIFKKYVLLNIVDDNSIRPVVEAKSLFNAEELAPEVGNALQVAGFKILYPLHNNGRRDETAVFLGASYFRPLAADQQFGASARGLAVDTASDRGEEFPYFREFWIKPSTKRTDLLRVYALMDSQSLTGAYSFVVHPGNKTLIEVEAHLFPRIGIEKVGIAPLTSMFVFGETPHPLFSDYRLEVHDSDGLLMWTGNNEWLWRPLQNPYPNGVRVTQYMDENPQGFGLMQRDTEYRHYLDLEARYDRRPSLWVAPEGSWGKGSVELVEISTAEETVDNIVAYWVPKTKLPVGTSTVFRYTVSAVARSDRHHSVGKAGRIRIGDYHDPGKPLDQKSGDKIFSVDFTDGILAELSEDEVKGVVEARVGTVRDIRVQKDPMIGGMRLWFRLTPGDRDTDIRMSLTRGRQQLTESVLYLFLKEE